MSKTKRKNGSELEYLRGEVKRLRAELKYHKRRSHIREEELVEDVIIENKLMCPECNESELNYLDLNHIKLLTCGNCGFKEKAK